MILLAPLARIVSMANLRFRFPLTPTGVPNGVRKSGESSVNATR